MSEKIEICGVSKTLAFSTAVAALGGLLFGFDTAVIAGTTNALKVYFHLTPITLGVTVSCALWGTVVGSLLASVPVERFGNRDSLRIVGVLYILSALGCASSSTWVGFLLFRFLGGIAIGGCSIFAPMYIAETSPAKIRGKLVGCFQLSIVTGILVAYASNYGIGLLHLGPHQWRAELGVAALPSLLFFIALAFIPRSPRWLLKHGRTTEAEQALAAIGFQDFSLEAQRIRASFAIHPEQRSTSILSPAFRRPLLIALALGLFNQLSGINAILCYVNDIFAQAGFTSVSSGEQAVFVGLANLLFTIVGMSLIDKVGRKPLLLAGALGMAAALGGVTSIFFSGLHRNLLLPLLVLFVAFFASSQGAVIWVYMSEIFPNLVRETGQSLASFWLWLLTALVAGLFPSMAATSSGYSFLFFCATMVVQFFVVLYFFPETRGWSLEANQCTD